MHLRAFAPLFALLVLVQTQVACSADASSSGSDTTAPADPAPPPNGGAGEPATDPGAAPLPEDKAAAPTPDETSPERPRIRAVLPLETVGQMFYDMSTTVRTQPASGVRIFLFDYASVCVKGDKANSTRLFIDLASTNGIVPGTYDITTYPAPAGRTTDVSARYQKLDGQCKAAQPELRSARGGTITITAKTRGQIAGSYDLVFDNGATMTGTFASDVCNPFTAPAAPSACF